MTEILKKRMCRRRAILGTATRKGGAAPQPRLLTLFLLLTSISWLWLRMGRLTGRLFVFFTTCLICFIAYSPQIFVIWPWYGRELSIELIKLLLPFKCVRSYCQLLVSLICVCSILVGMLLWNYRLCVITEPGRVPPSWVCAS